MPTFYRALLEATGEWATRWPHSPFPWLERLGAVSQLGDVPAPEVERTADNLLRTSVEGAGSFRTTPPMPLLVAEVYLQYGLRIERVPELVQSSLREMKLRTERDEQSKSSPEMARYARKSLWLTSWNGMALLTDAHLRLKQTREARAVLEAMSGELARYKADAAAAPAEKEDRARFQATHWELQARLAEAENRTLEAFVFYQQALAIRPAQKGTTGERERLESKIRQLWTTLGGTDEGWANWSRREATGGSEAGVQLANAWESVDEPLPGFTLIDLRGRGWRLAEPFLKERGYTFPVIPAREYVQRFRPDAIIPRSWIVSPEGILRMEHVGFEREANDWLEQVLKQLQSAGAPTNRDTLNVRSPKPTR